MSCRKKKKKVIRGEVQKIGFVHLSLYYLEWIQVNLSLKPVGGAEKDCQSVAQSFLKL